MGQKIDRFEILNELGKGGQGAVYLARDSQLDRLVAIKTLRNLGHKTEQLEHEARIVSKLQHPNIITLFHSGEYLDSPYLVYAYVEGKTLAQLLKQEKPLPLMRAVEIACGVLEGLAYAHSQDVSHLDIKPSNVMIAKNGTPMVMDFGLAKTANHQQTTIDAALSGTPRYMAPELISGKQIAFMADIYSVGAMLYEMVTGEFAVRGENIFEVLNRAAHEEIIPPSAHNKKVDEKLEAIILTALAKDPNKRYQNALLMKQALQGYLDEAKAAATHSTMEFLLRRMRSKSDFPALSSVISEINQIVASESDSTSKLVGAILQDFALTHKLLRLVNTASYGQFGGTINTISKAVVILGFETARNIAMTLVLLEFLQNKAQAAQLKDEIIKSVFAGIVAAQLSDGQNIRDAEEVIVCSMFHNLGSLLATFYFFEESQEISRLVEQGESEEEAAHKVLGLTYPELGLGVARSWNFPPRLLAGMRKLGGNKIQPAEDELDQMAVTVNLAYELCEIASSTSVKDKPQFLRDLTQRYGDANEVSERQLSAALDSGLGELTLRAGTLGISTANSLLLKKVRNWCEYSSIDNPPKDEVANELDGITELGKTSKAHVDDADDMNRPMNPDAILGAGIQDVTASLVGEFNLNDLLQMILETIYRGMGFNRAIIMIRNNKDAMMVAKFGFGPGLEAIIPKFRFPLHFFPDVFHLSTEKGVDIAIEDIHAPNIADKVPVWYRSTINAPCFMLLPVMVKGKAIALFYADMLEPNSLNMSKQQLSLLRTLRDQAILAIKQKV
ncbi:MAG: protein kinase [Gallionellaceae bacterium]|nr:protein kinase [Gallionellaceae bacterium]